MEIRQSTESDKPEIKNIHLAAFGQKEGPIIVDLINNLLKDQTAKPLLSLVALKNQKLIGHILFTRVQIDTDKSIPAQILAPLAVSPQEQKSGVGKNLIKEGLTQLKKSGTALVFVLGHPAYYSRFGFSPAGEKGFEATYPIAPKNAPAWMVQQLNGNAIGKIKGKVQCAKALDRPELWIE